MCLSEREIGEDRKLSETFTKESMREKHHNKVKRILSEGGGTDDIVNYIMSRISYVISYERNKYERRILQEWSKNYETRNQQG